MVAMHCGKLTTRNQGVFMDEMNLTLKYSNKTTEIGRFLNGGSRVVAETHSIWAAGCGEVIGTACCVWGLGA